MYYFYILLHAAMSLLSFVRILFKLIARFIFRSFNINVNVRRRHFFRIERKKIMQINGITLHQNNLNRTANSDIHFGIFAGNAAEIAGKIVDKNTMSILKTCREVIISGTSPDTLKFRGINSDITENLANYMADDKTPERKLRAAAAYIRHMMAMFG